MINLEEFSAHKDVITYNVNMVNFADNLLKRVREFQALLEDASKNVYCDPETDEAIGGAEIMLDELAAQLEMDLKLAKSKADSNYRALQRKIFDAE